MFALPAPASDPGSSVAYVDHRVGTHNKCENYEFLQSLVNEISSVPFPTKIGKFKLKLFEDKINGDHHVAIVKGNINSDEIKIRKTANIEGVLNQKTLSIEEGATLKIKTETYK